TLIGAGGSGKTRLAIRVATELMYSEDASRLYKDGVWWVDLSSLYDPSLVVQTVAQALAVRELANESLGETLGRHLAPKFLLLVLDNCDHLTRDVARLVVALLSATPSVRILATSRVPLGMAGEYLYDVLPLSAPPPNAKSLIDLFLSF